MLISPLPFGESLARKDVEVTDRLLKLTQCGHLQIRIPAKTINTKLYILAKPGRSRLIQTSANLTEAPRSGTQVNYAWYFDVTADYLCPYA